MSTRIRRGMLIKNLGTESLTIRMISRKLTLGPGDEAALTPDEVRDPVMRENLQVRTIAIVRPTTPEEDEELQNRLAAENDTAG